MKPMYLPAVERPGSAGVPQIHHLLAFKPAMTGLLEEFSEAVMRGPSPLSAGFRELIAAFTSAANGCVF